MHMTPMQQTEVMVKMVSESMKAVLRSNQKRTRKRELWESEETEETTDDDEDEGGTILSARKLLSGMDHEATFVEMSRLGVQTPYDLRQTTTTSAWAERCNTLLTQNAGVRQRLMLSNRGMRGANPKPPEGQREPEVEKKRWLAEAHLVQQLGRDVDSQEGDTRGRHEPRRDRQGADEGQGTRGRATQDRVPMRPGQERCDH